MLDTMVVEITADRRICCINTVDGYQELKAGAVVLAMGCRSAPAGPLPFRATGLRYFYRGRGTALCQYGRLHGRPPGGHSRFRRYRPYYGAPHDAGGCQGAGLRRALPLFQRPEPQYRPVHETTISPVSFHTYRYQGRERVEQVVISQVDEARRPFPAPSRPLTAIPCCFQSGLSRKTS